MKVMKENYTHLEQVNQKITEENEAGRKPDPYLEILKRKFEAQEQKEGEEEARRREGEEEAGTGEQKGDI